MKKRPVLKGFSEDVNDYYTAAKEGRVLRIGLQIDTPNCSWRCPYCYTDEGTKESLQKTAPINEVKDWINQAKGLGATGITINGTFEPTMGKDLLEILRHSVQAGLNATMVSNGTLLNEALITELKSLNVSVLLKLNVPMADKDDQNYEKFRVIQAQMAGLPERSNIYDHILKNIGALIRHGFNTPIEQDGKITTSLGVESVITSKNADLLPILSRQLRDLNIYTHFEVLKVQGTCRDNPDMQITKENLERVFKHILEDDIKDGFEPFLPHPPYIGGTCYQNLIRINIAANGDIKPCPGVDIVIGNLREKNMKEIINESKVLKVTRHLEEKIQGDCRDCPQMKNRECYGGCRGTAYQELTKMGYSRDEALVASDPSCWRVNKVLGTTKGAELHE